MNIKNNSDYTHEVFNELEIKKNKVQLCNFEDCKFVNCNFSEAQFFIEYILFLPKKSRLRIENIIFVFSGLARLRRPFIFHFYWKSV